MEDDGTRTMSTNNKEQLRHYFLIFGKQRTQIFITLQLHFRFKTVVFSGKQVIEARAGLTFSDLTSRYLKKIQRQVI